MSMVRCLGVLLLGLVLSAWPANAELEKSLVKRLPLDKPPLDIAQSVSDGRLFVLLEGGEVQVFSTEGQQQERFKVGAGITSLEVSPDGQRLYLGSVANKELLFLDVTTVHELPVNNSAFKGPENAPVTITVFDDFQCPYCARLVPIMDQVLSTYPKQVRLVFKQFPLSMHKFARTAAIASLAARNQDSFWPLYDQLFANFNQLDDAKIRDLAKGIGLDMARFDRDIANPALEQEVAADIQLGIQAGVRGTPAAYVNGKPVKERSVKGFQAMIEAELKKPGQ